MISEGLAAPDFTLPATGGASVTLSSLRGKRVVLFAYGKDGTPTCTGYIDAAPAVIKQPGTWCLRHDVVAKPLGPATAAGPAKR